MKTIKILRKDVPIRMILFFFIGFIYVFYFFVSVIFFEKLANSSGILIPIFILFWIIYPIVSLLLLSAIDYLKKFYKWLYTGKDKENESKKNYEETELTKVFLFDVIGYYFGAIVAGVIVGVAAIIGVVILLGRGIVWLIQHPYPFGVLAIGILLLAFLAFFVYKKCMEFNEFLYSLSFFPDFKI